MSQYRDNAHIIAWPQVKNKRRKGLLRINRIKRIIKLKSDKRHYFGQTALFKLNHFWHECQNLINLI